MRCPICDRYMAEDRARAVVWCIGRGCPGRDAVRLLGMGKPAAAATWTEVDRQQRGTWRQRNLEASKA